MNVHNIRIFRHVGQENIVLKLNCCLLSFQLMYPVFANCINTLALVNEMKIQTTCK